MNKENHSRQPGRRAAPYTLLGGLVGLFAVVTVIIGIANTLTGKQHAVGTAGNQPSSTRPHTTSATKRTPTTNAQDTPRNKESASNKKEQNYTMSQSQAIASAKNYLSTRAFSKKGLLEQLSSPEGDGFSTADATFAVNHITVDWDDQAVRAAKGYLRTEPLTESALIHQLHSRYGDQFTLAQAQHAAKIVFAPN